MSGSKKWAILSGAAVVSALSVGRASAVLTIYGTTPYSNTTVGYTGNTLSVASGGPNAIGTGGIAVGNGRYWYSPPSTNYTTGWILTSSGTTLLAPVAGQPAGTSGGTPVVVKSINTAGTLITGLTASYEASGASYTNTETVWNSSGGAIALPVPLTDSIGSAPTISSGLINNGGTVIGSGIIYNPTNSGSTHAQLTNAGAFVWTNSGTAAAPVYSSYSELLAPNNSTGTVATGNRSEAAYGINDLGLAVGSGSLYSGSTATGSTAVTWDTTSTPSPGATTGTTQSTIAPVVLTNPTLPASNTTFGSGNYSYSSASGSGTGTVTTPKTTSSAGYVNGSNVIAGTASVYNASSASTTTGAYTPIGYEPVIWKGAGSTGAFLPYSSTSYNQGNVVGINTLGDVIGSEINTGLQQAVLWKYGSTSPTVLAAPTGTNPLTGSAYTSFTNVKGVNDADYSVGYLGSSTGDATGTNALLWSPTGSVTDLNTLIGPEVTTSSTSAGWVSLLAADSISDDGWITGVGVYYDPTATGYSTGALGSTPGEYYRQFLIQDTAAVPEPASAVILLAITAFGTLRRRRPTHHD